MQAMFLQAHVLTRHTTKKKTPKITFFIQPTPYPNTTTYGVSRM